MDSFLDGRERVGDRPKSKEPAQLTPRALGELKAPQSEDAVVEERCGEGGSKIQYVTESGRVTRILVTCACGQVTEIDCQYDD